MRSRQELRLLRNLHAVQSIKDVGLLPQASILAFINTIAALKVVARALSRKERPVRIGRAELRASTTVNESSKYVGPFSLLVFDGARISVAREDHRYGYGAHQPGLHIWIALGSSRRRDAWSWRLADLTSLGDDVIWAGEAKLGAAHVYVVDDDAPTEAGNESEAD